MPLLLLLFLVLPHASVSVGRKAACNGKATGADCTFTYSQGPNEGKTVDGACASTGDCDADAGSGTTNTGGTVPGGGSVKITCPVVGGTPFTGDAKYVGKNPIAAPLRGAVGCLDLGVLVSY